MHVFSSAVRESCSVYDSFGFHDHVLSLECTSLLSLCHHLLPSFTLPAVCTASCVHFRCGHPAFDHSWLTHQLINPTVTLVFPLEKWYLFGFRREREVLSPVKKCVHSVSADMRNLLWFFSSYNTNYHNLLCTPNVSTDIFENMFLWTSNRPFFCGRIQLSECQVQFFFSLD